MNKNYITILSLTAILLLMSRLYYSQWRKSATPSEEAFEAETNDLPQEEEIKDAAVEEAPEPADGTPPPPLDTALSDTTAQAQQDQGEAPHMFKAEHTIITKPILVKTHRSHHPYVFLQDEQHQLYFISDQGNIIWKKKLGEPIVTPVFTVDFYKNNKIQYVFATTNHLYLIDYNGNGVGKYPYKLPQGHTIQYLSVVDYEGKKDYRFLVADNTGNLYLLSQQGALLPKWDPVALQGTLAVQPTHLRVGAKDYFVAAQQNGTLHLLNRQSKAVPGFPVKLEAPIRSMIVIQGSSPTFTLITEHNKRYTFSLSGKSQAAEILPNPKNTPLQLCQDEVQANSYVIARKDANKLVIMDPQGQVLLEKKYSASNKSVIQYFKVGNHLIYAILDPSHAVTWLYNQAGAPLCKHPLPSTHAISIAPLPDNKIVVYSTDNNYLYRQICEL